MGIKTKHLHGYDPDVDNARSMVSAIGDVTILETAIAIVDVASGDAKDDGSPAGVGTQTITFEYLNSDYEEVSQAITMNGVGQVATGSLSFLKLNAAYSTAVGTELNNAGAITISDDDQSDTFGTILAGINCMQQAIYTVPASKTVWIDKIFLAGGTYDDEMHFYLVADVNPTTNLRTSTIYHDWGCYWVAGSTTMIDLRDRPIKMPEKSTFYFDAFADAGNEIGCVHVVFREEDHVA